VNRLFLFLVETGRALVRVVSGSELVVQCSGRCWYREKGMVFWKLVVS
jgi:hypothetical protein